jgi:hypothetical protein
MLLRQQRKVHRRPFLGAAKLRIIFETPSLLSDYFRSCCISVSLHWYLVGNALMTPTVVVVLDVILDALPQKDTKEEILTLRRDCRKYLRKLITN